MSAKPKLSIIILSYNTKKLLKDCLDSIAKLRKEITLEVIVPDNGSKDGSSEMVKKDFPWVKLVENNANLGFAKGNNSARKYCNGEYILFLNSDTIVPKGTLSKTVKYMDQNENIGALTCKLIMADGQLDKDARRSFPTPWVALTHLILKLDKIFPRSKLFARYWYGYESADKISKVDVIQGAYFLAKKKTLDSVDWFSEEYFLDGEDIDLCYKITQKGFDVIYYPKVSILHLKGASKGKNKSTSKKVPIKEKIKFRTTGVNSMEIFYRKFMWKKYPLILNLMVLSGIRLVKATRIIKTYLE